MADRRGQPFYRGLVEHESDRRLGQLLAIAQEDATLPKEPHRCDCYSAVISIWHEATHQIGGEAEEWRGLFGDQTAEYRGRLHGFPIEDAHMAAVFVAAQQRLQLAAHELHQRFFP